MKISLESIAKGISASHMAAIARSGCVFHEPWMRDYAYKSHQKAFWAEVQRVTRQLPESGDTVASWLSSMVREEAFGGEAPTPELYLEAADYILRWCHKHYAGSPFVVVGWNHYQKEKKTEQRRARLAAMAPADFRVEWDGRPKDRAAPFWERPAGREELIQLATPEQLATLTTADLAPLLANGDPEVRTDALRALGKVSRPQEERKAA